MATRPIFIPTTTARPLVQRKDVEFEWFPGMSASQKKRSIGSMHRAAVEVYGVERILEISSKSEDDLGIALSAFNLTFPIGEGGRRLSVECAYQGSKVFEQGGPYTDIYSLTAREAKRDERLHTSGQLIGFRFFNREWPLEPPTAFYDWLYINTLLLNIELIEQLEGYSAFTDIEFNPQRSVNCQANSVALFVALKRRNLLDDAMNSQDSFITIIQQDDPEKAKEDTCLAPRLL